MNYITQKSIILLKPYLKKSKHLLKKIFKKEYREFFRHKLEYSDQSHYQYKKFDPLSKVLYEIFHITILLFLT